MTSLRIRSLATTALATTLAGGLIAVAGLVPAHAKDFYEGKQLKVIVGSSAGGGYDTYARVISRHMGNFLPGNPALVVQNMPGGSSRKAANYVYNIAPKDGTVITALFSGIPTDPLINPKQVKFDVQKFNWLGSASKETFVGYVWNTAPAQTLEDLKTKQMIVGGSGGATTDFPKLSKAILGLKFKIVEGYPGTKQIGLAIERGELQGDAGITWTSVKTQHSDWLRDKKIRVFVQYGAKPNPDLKDVPLMLDLAKTKADRQALALSFLRGEAQRPYTAPPGLPAERVAMLRKAFVETLKDKAFLADAKKRHLEVEFVSPEEMSELIAGYYQTPKSVVDRVKKIVSAK